jgi:hypothetical protein
MQLEAQLLCNQQDHAIMTFADDNTLLVTNAPNGINRFQLNSNRWAFTETISIGVQGQLGAQLAAAGDVMVVSYRPLCRGVSHAALLLLRRASETGDYALQGYLWCEQCDSVTTGQPSFDLSTTHVLVQLAGFEGVQIIPLPGSNWSENAANGWQRPSQAYCAAVNDGLAPEASHLVVNGSFSQVSVNANYAVGVGIWNNSYAAHFFSRSNTTVTSEGVSGTKPDRDVWQHAASLPLSCPGWRSSHRTVSMSASLSVVLIHAAGEMTVCAAHLPRLDLGFVPTNFEPKGETIIIL